jgi:hypothetical protein
LLAEVTHAQAQKAVAALKQRGDGDEGLARHSVSYR